MSEQRAERCETCRFWAFDLNSGGTCKRFPPVINFQAIVIDAEDSDSACDRARDCGWSVQPGTVGNDWCGEWQGEQQTPEPVDLAKLTSQLSKDAIKRRLDELHAETQALGVLYRSASAREHAIQRRKPKDAPKEV